MKVQKSELPIVKTTGFAIPASLNTINKMGVNKIYASDLLNVLSYLSSKSEPVGVVERMF